MTFYHQVISYFFRFALKDGQLWLGHNQAILVWDGLALSCAFPSDRDACFRWFSKVSVFHHGCIFTVQQGGKAT